MSKQVNVKAYPKDFKEQVVKLAQVGDRSATQIAREFEISREWSGDDLVDGGDCVIGRVVFD